MLPGLTRTAAQPASIAANTYLGWKWMSAITGICDFVAIAGSASASSCAGAGDPHDVAARGGQLGDLLQRGVDVGGQRGGHRLHRDRRLAAHANLADLDLSGLAARRQHGWRGCGHAKAYGGHVFDPSSGQVVLIGTTRSPTINTTPMIIKVAAIP
jgi:hypothetical protein